MRPIVAYLVPAACVDGPRGFLKSYDPEAHEGIGHVELTPNRAEARVFSGMAEFIATYHAVPKCHPIRTLDGLPNRPLTAFHAETMAVDDPQGPTLL